MYKNSRVKEYMRYTGKLYLEFGTPDRIFGDRAPK